MVPLQMITETVPNSIADESTGGHGFRLQLGHLLLHELISDVGSVVLDQKLD